MANTSSRKRPGATRVADMTTGELREMIEPCVESKLIEMLRDPDVGLELRPELAESLERQEQQFAAGARGKPLGEVVKRLALD